MILSFSLSKIDIRYNKNNLQLFITKLNKLRKHIKDKLQINDLNLYREYYVNILEIFPGVNILLKYLVRVYFDLVRVRWLCKMLDERVSDLVSICGVILRK
ncbi:hypothetical protein NAPIS_ORF00576 [Vairimorpha apis BRL 01]|uniref:Uncharacterized protein n=1 Tax=Vairimorpha apis BRL 01 TaxID=1037528 RepID=T0LC39_9MICR|nr:hypothetical protein NAPIS_ORF00576 [Vairimorpha apis BRL 01]